MKHTSEATRLNFHALYQSSHIRMSSPAWTTATKTRIHPAAPVMSSPAAIFIIILFIHPIPPVSLYFLILRLNNPL